METPFKLDHVFRFGSPSNTVYKGFTDTPDFLKFLSPSMMLISSKKINSEMSPVVGTSLFNTDPQQLENLICSPATPRSSTTRTARRRLLVDKERCSPLYRNKSEKGDVYLQNLQRNPMFEDLSKLLAEECLHMQAPTNLMNVTWDTTAHFARMPKVHEAHLSLQKKFLQFRSKEKYVTKAREIECRYSKEINRIEVARYLQISSGHMTLDQYKTTNDCFNQCRLQLIKETSMNLDEMMLQEKLHNVQQNRNQITPTSEISSCFAESSKSPNAEDVLGLAMAATVILPPVVDLTTHTDMPIRSGYITRLMESFTVPRQDVLCSEIQHLETQQPTTTHQERRSMKRKPQEDLQALSENQPQKKAKSETMPSKSGQITQDATTILTDWYEQHVQYPYPKDEEVATLSNQTGLTFQQVKKWMANKRIRCFNTLSITGNKHPIKAKLAGKKKADNVNAYKQLGDQAKAVLGEWYQQHLENPYPTEHEKEELALRAGITVPQVKSWFANRRSRANNRRRQIPNYFLEKFPQYASHVQMVQVHRDQSRKRCRSQHAPMGFLEPEIVNQQNCFF